LAGRNAQHKVPLRLEDFSFDKGHVLHQHQLSRKQQVCIDCLQLAAKIRAAETLAAAACRAGTLGGRHKFSLAYATSRIGNSCVGLRQH